MTDKPYHEMTWQELEGTAAGGSAGVSIACLIETLRRVGEYGIPHRSLRADAALSPIETAPQCNQDDQPEDTLDLDKHAILRSLRDTREEVASQFFNRAFAATRS